MHDPLFAFFLERARRRSAMMESGADDTLFPAYSERPAGRPFLAARASAAASPSAPRAAQACLPSSSTPTAQHVLGSFADGSATWRPARPSLQLRPASCRARRPASGAGGSRHPQRRSPFRRCHAVIQLLCPPGLDCTAGAEPARRRRDGHRRRPAEGLVVNLRRRKATTSGRVRPRSDRFADRRVVSSAGCGTSSAQAGRRAGLIVPAWRAASDRQDRRHAVVHAHWSRLASRADLQRDQAGDDHQEPDALPPGVDVAYHRAFANPGQIRRISGVMIPPHRGSLATAWVRGGVAGGLGPDGRRRLERVVDSGRLRHVIDAPVDGVTGIPEEKEDCSEHRHPVPS